MPRHILLTGAGFSRNWGGWLAGEAFEYLLGSNYIDDLLRAKLWVTKESGGGFEQALANLQADYATKPYDQPEQDLRNLTAAIRAMFAEMAAGYEQVEFEFQKPVELPFSIRQFLGEFEAIYTLNQDTLIEQKCPGLVTIAGIVKPTCPGIRLMKDEEQIGAHYYRLYEPDPANFQRPVQPYIKLHGSFNWAEDRGSILIIGGNKPESIERHALLKWYHQMFREDLAKPDTRLMVIGYSFTDDHINQTIINACASTNLRIFIIDPLGVDILDKRKPPSESLYRAKPEPLLATLAPRILGASRRYLSEIFGNDRVEHAKVMRFLRR